MKKLILVISLAAALCFMNGCGDRESSQKLEGFKMKAQIEEQNISLAKQYVEAFNKGDFEALGELLSPDYVIYNPSGTSNSVPREKLIENYEGAAEAFSEFNWNIEDIIAAGDKVVCRIVARADYKGGIPDIPADPKKLEFSLISIMRMKDGKIIEEWQEDDQLGLARQLGMELKPK